MQKVVPKPTETETEESADALHHSADRYSGVKVKVGQIMLKDFDRDRPPAVLKHID